MVNGIPTREEALAILHEFTRLRPEAPGISPGRKGEAGASAGLSHEAPRGAKSDVAGLLGTTGVSPWGSTQSAALRKHAIAVEAALRVYARKFGEEEHLYGVVGLLHDFDYERYPDAADHPLKGSEILRERGVSEEIREAILSHATVLGKPRDTNLKKALFACDELCGFIMAVTAVRPSKKIAEVTVESVLKKLKQKGFAAKVSREDITQGTAELGVPLAEHIVTVLSAMQLIADTLGV